MGAQSHARTRLRMDSHRWPVLGHIQLCVGAVNPDVHHTLGRASVARHQVCISRRAICSQLDKQILKAAVLSQIMGKKTYQVICSRDPPNSQT